MFVCRHEGVGGEDKCISLGVNACVAVVSLFSLQPNLCTATAKSVSGSGWMSSQPTVSRAALSDERRIFVVSLGRKPESVYPFSFRLSRGPSG